MSIPSEFAAFQRDGLIYNALEMAQKKFEAHVDNVETLHDAVLWFSEEVGELASIIRREDEAHYPDAIGDLVLWCITLARLLNVEVAEAVAYSTRQLIAKGYTNLSEGSHEVE